MSELFWRAIFIGCSRLDAYAIATIGIQVPACMYKGGMEANIEPLRTNSQVPYKNQDLQ